MFGCCFMLSRNLEEKNKCGVYTVSTNSEKFPNIFKVQLIQTYKQYLEKLPNIQYKFESATSEYIREFL